MFLLYLLGFLTLSMALALFFDMRRKKRTGADVIGFLLFLGVVGSGWWMALSDVAIRFETRSTYHYQAAFTESAALVSSPAGYKGVNQMFLNPDNVRILRRGGPVSLRLGYSAFGKCVLQEAQVVGGSDELIHLR